MLQIPCIRQVSSGKGSRTVLRYAVYLPLEVVVGGIPLDFNPVERIKGYVCVAVVSGSGCAIEVSHQPDFYVP